MVRDGSLIKEMVEDARSELVGLHLKVVLSGESCVISRNYLALKGAFQDQGPKCQSIKNTENNYTQYS